MSLRLTNINRYTGHEGAVYSCCSAGEGHFLTSGGDGWIVRWRIDGDEPGKLLAKVPGVVFSLEYHPLFDLIVAGDMQGGLHWIYPNRSHLNRDVSHHQEGVFTIRAWKQYLFTGGARGLLSCWQAGDGALLRSVRLSSTRIRTMAFHPEKEECFVGTSDGSLIQLTIPELELVRRIDQAHDNTVFCNVYHPSGKYLYSGGRDARLRSWSLEDGVLPLDEQPAHRFTVNDLCIEPGGNRLFSASRDKTIRVWDPGTLELLHAIDRDPENAHLNSVNTLLWIPGDHRRFISGSDDRTLILWKVEE